MKHDFPGLLNERMASGAYRWRVRVKGDKARRILIHCGPDHHDFQKQYLAARAGHVPDQIKPASEYSTPRSIGWLVNKYLEFVEARVEAGLTSHKTLKKKRNLLNRLLIRPDREMLIPQHKLLEMQDRMSSTPAQADAFIEAVAVMYDWAMKRKIVGRNPARGIDKIYVKGSGATPWEVRDVKQFFSHHKAGTKGHVALSVLLWTGCRVEDLTVLGRGHECTIDGIDAVRWQPLKKGSSEVSVPLLPPLREATRAPKVLGATYLLGRGGRPYSSGDSMSATFIQWCRDAGLVERSAHGVRKCLGELLAELGCSQYGIMAILGHSEARTSEVYTRRVERWRLANEALNRIDVSQLGFDAGHSGG